MFRKKCINLYHCHLKQRMLSHVSVSQKNITDYPSITTVSHHSFDNLPYRRYCVESSNKATYTDPNSLISQQYEAQECLDNLPSAMDSKVKYRNYKERCIKNVEKALKCSASESLTLYQQYPCLFHDNIVETIKKIELLTNSEISEKNIFKNIDILELSDDEIAYKLEQMNEWGLNEDQKSDVLALMKLESRLFDKITVRFRSETNLIPERNRLIYLSRVLECSLEKATDLSMKYEHLLTRSFENMNETFELLLDNGISPQCIQNNLWFSVHSSENIKKWLNSLKSESAWDGKFDKNNFTFLQKLVEKEKHERTFLKPNQSREEFLAEKLQMDVNVIKYLVTKFPGIFNQDLCRLTKVIDFLYSQGYTGEQICVNTTILNKNIKSLQNRLDEFRSAGCNFVPLSFLYGPKAKYKSYLKNWTSHPS